MKKEIAFGLVLAVVGLLAFLLGGGWTAFGARATGAPLARPRAPSRRRPRRAFA